MVAYVLNFDDSIPKLTCIQVMFIFWKLWWPFLAFIGHFWPLLALDNFLSKDQPLVIHRAFSNNQISKPWFPNQNHRFIAQCSGYDTFLFTNHFCQYWAQCSRWVTDASLEPSKTDCDFPSIQPFVVPFVQQSNLCFLPIHGCPYYYFLGKTSRNFSVSMKLENQYVHIHIQLI